MDDRVAHALSIDVECYYQIFLRNRFGKTIEPKQEVVECTNRILDLLQVHRTKATFFVVGRVAVAFPELVRRIVRDGHELGSHGHEHVYVNQISKKEFRDDLRLSKQVLEDIGETSLLGFRAPQFSIDRTTPWAYEILADEGFLYDSSVFPFRGRRYGDADAPAIPWLLNTSSGEILEVPLSTVSVGRRRFPIAGGGYLRYFPYFVTSTGMSFLEKEGRSAVVYLHPYEFATRSREACLDQAVHGAGWRLRLGHRMQLINRSHSLSKLSRLLTQFHFNCIADAFGVRSP